LLAWTGSQIETLYPGCFAFVMATGIISNALLAENFREFSDLLFAINGLAYFWLAMLTILRAVRFPRALRSDLVNPQLAFSFFTLIAGSNVLGEGMYLRGFTALAFYLWLFSLLTWLILFYFSFAVWIFFNAGSGAAVMQGGWLLAIVGTQSLVVLGAALAPRMENFDAAIVILIYVLWGVGLGLYVIYAVLFTYRLLFFEVRPDDLTPALWVVMGAAAISANAGSMLMDTESGLPYLHVVRPFVDGVTPIVWAWATLWIPLLALLGIWKHAVRRVPLVYTPLLWSFVFPLGMYSAATLRFALVSHFPSLRPISSAMLWIAVAAWVMTFAAFAFATWRSLHEFESAATVNPYRRP
jgi:tellurite resistance protein TehA-like permease